MTVATPVSPVRDSDASEDVSIHGPVVSATLSPEFIEAGDQLRAMAAQDRADADKRESALGPRRGKFADLPADEQAVRREIRVMRWHATRTEHYVDEITAVVLQAS